MQNLQDALGLNVKCEPEWPIIVLKLRWLYEEAGVDLTASVTGLIKGLCEAIVELADVEKWADALWTRLRDTGRKVLSILLEVSNRQNNLQDTASLTGCRCPQRALTSPPQGGTIAGMGSSCSFPRLLSQHHSSAFQP